MSDKSLPIVSIDTVNTSSNNNNNNETHNADNRTTTSSDTKLSSTSQLQQPQQLLSTSKIKQVGDYILGPTLGSGSFGKVKLATNIRNNERVAIKLVDKHSISHVDDVERVYRETFILTQLKHNNIIRLHDVIDNNDSIMLVMEYASGGDLYSYVMSRNRLNEYDACILFTQILNGVEYCHRNRVIHRDLKLENILLDKNKNIKIADFGLSNSIKMSIYGKHNMTNCGTPSYTCPEQINKLSYSGM